MGSSLEEDLVKLATELAAEPSDPQAPTYRDVHPYSTFRIRLGRPYSLWFLRAVKDTVTGAWETERVAGAVDPGGERPKSPPSSWPVAASALSHA
jgi:hypothetical protein